MRIGNLTNGFIFNDYYRYKPLLKMFSLLKNYLLLP